MCSAASRGASGCLTAGRAARAARVARLIRVRVRVRVRARARARARVGVRARARAPRPPLPPLPPALERSALEAVASAGNSTRPPRSGLVVGGSFFTLTTSLSRQPSPHAAHEAFHGLAAFFLAEAFFADLPEAKALATALRSELPRIVLDALEQQAAVHTSLAGAPLARRLALGDETRGHENG